MSLSSFVIPCLCRRIMVWIAIVFGGTMRPYLRHTVIAFLSALFVVVLTPRPYAQGQERIRDSIQEVERGGAETIDFEDSSASLVAATDAFDVPALSDEPSLETQSNGTPRVSYTTHVQTYGWQGWAADGAMSGTEGQAKRLEGIRIQIPDAPCAGGVRYRTHVQTYGWQGWAADGAMSGTEGQAKRLEGIEVQLTGEMASRYDVWYRVHAQSFGWMGWARNGEQAGTAGYSKRLEAIQIVLTAKESAGPAANLGGITSVTAEPFKSGVPTVSTSPSSGQATSRGPASAGALSVKGSQLVDKGGKPIQLTGISTHGLAWYPAYVNDACFHQLRNEWNANVVRLAMYTEEYGGYCTGANKSDLVSLVKNGVRLATSNDLYAIVDWHILSDGNPLRHVDEAKSFFADVSSTFRNNVNVIYEICNEPNGGTSWNDIKSYANQIIPVIRKNDPDAVIIVGTPTWSQEVDKAASSRLSYSNVMYALHFYAATHKDDLRNRLIRTVREGLPVFVSEFGICDASGNGSIDQGSANTWIATLNDLGVSWCMWSLSNKPESASAIKSTCSATSGFGTSDLTESGTWLLKALHGALPAVSSGTTSGTTESPVTPSGGTVSFSSGTFVCKATPTNSWQTGDGKTCFQYDLSITNSGAACSSWAITIPFNEPISFVNGWNGVFGASGSTLTIRNADYNGHIESGATISGIGFQVTAGRSLAVMP